MARYAHAFAQIVVQQNKGGNFKPSGLYVLAKLFLNKRGQKWIVPNIIKDHLTARGLAYWYMDDGGMADKGRYATNLHTQRFEGHRHTHEVQALCKDISAKFAFAARQTKINISIAL